MLFEAIPNQMLTKVRTKMYYERLPPFLVNWPSKTAKHYIVFDISQTKLQEYIRIKTKHGYQVACFAIFMSVI